ncbi:MAG: homoserine kinase [Fidelibacterota bacterium]
MKQTVSAFAPATVANVGCGFDVFGFAIAEPGDTVRVSRRAGPGVVITTISGDDGRLPKNADENTAGFAVLRYLEKIKSREGIDIELTKQLPLGSGMGSSAASAVAALKAVNCLYDNPLSKEELLEIAIAAEASACGSSHADNVAPALYGGFVLIRTNDPPDIIRLPVPEKLHCTLIHPDIEIKTRDARNILPATIPLTTAVKQWANTAGLVAGLYQKNFDLLRRSSVDYIAEPLRSTLIPCFNEVKQTAMDHGAIACSISGSGPALFALSASRKTAQKVALAMGKVFTRHSIAKQVYISGINSAGARIIHEE